MDKYYVGTEFKCALTITSEGFNMDEDPWVATVTCGKNSITCKPSLGAISDEHGWKILVDSQVLGTGPYYLSVEIDVPDEDFADGYRHEVLKMEKPLCVVNKL